MRPTTAITLLALGWSLGLFAQQETLEQLAARAARDPGDHELVKKVVGTASFGKIQPAAIPNLRELFANLTEKVPRQELALALLRAGQKDAIYFDELTKYVRIAIAVGAPWYFARGVDGNFVTDRLNPELNTWCDSNRLLLQDCINRIESYAGDIMQLAGADDVRAAPVLRQALAMSNPRAVKFAAIGLCRIKDTDSIPLIVENLRRFPSASSADAAEALVGCDDPRVGPLLDEFVADPKRRQEIEALRNRKAPQN
jgi:HEAT repeat protein